MRRDFQLSLRPAQHSQREFSLKHALALIRALFGDTRAQISVAYRFYLDIDNPRSLSRALYWAGRAAENGEAAGYLLVANVLTSRAGDDESKKQIFAAYMGAAELGSAEGQQAVAWCFEQGVGVQRNLDLAVSWWKMAANNGSRASQLELARRYAEGDGLPMDMESSLKYMAMSGQ